MRHAYGNAYIHSDINANGHAYSDSYADGNCNGNAYTNSNSYGSGHSHTYSDGYSCLTYTDMSARQPVHDHTDRWQHRAGYNGHRQSRG
jgi:hypothetical protein